MSHYKVKARVSGLGSGVILIVAMLIAVCPILWIILTSFKTQAQTFSIPPVVFFHPVLSNYFMVFSQPSDLLALENSLITAVGGSVLSVLVGTMGAYALAQFPIPGKKEIWFWIISNRMLPPVVAAIPLFILAVALKLYDTRILLIIVYAAFNLPIVVWLMVSMFQGIPRDVGEAAVMDGAGPIGVFFRVMLPQVAPGLAVSGMFSFLFSWNAFLIPFILTQSQAQTMPVVAATYSAGFGVEWGAIAAIGTVIIIPPLILAVVSSKYIVRGLSMGAIR